MSGKSVQQIALRKVAHIDQNAAEFVASLALEFKGAIQIFGRDEAAMDQKFAQAHGCSAFHGRFDSTWLSGHYSFRSSISAASSACVAWRATASSMAWRFADIDRRHGSPVWSS